MVAEQLNSLKINKINGLRNGQTIRCVCVCVGTDSSRTVSASPSERQHIGKLIHFVVRRARRQTTTPTSRLTRSRVPCVRMHVILNGRDWELAIWHFVRANESDAHFSSGKLSPFEGAPASRGSSSSSILWRMMFALHAPERFVSLRMSARTGRDVANAGFCGRPVHRSTYSKVINVNM